MKQILTRKYWEDQDVAALAGRSLRTGVLTASITTITGGILYLAHHAGERPAYHTFTGASPDLRHLGGIWQQVLRADGMGIIQLGVVFLIATPIVRILLSVIGFAVERDYVYVGITLLVLAIILFNMYAGLGG